MATKSDQKLYSYLSELGIVDAKKLEQLFAQSQENDQPLELVLSRADLISPKVLGKILADFYELPFVYLAETAVELEVLNILPEAFARKQKAIAFNASDSEVHIAVNQPDQEKISSSIEKKVGKKVVFHFALLQDIEDAFQWYATNINQELDQLLKSYQEKGTPHSESDPPIIKIVDTLIKHAYQSKASDIHLEPSDDYYLVRYRIDGILHDIVKLPVELHPPIVTRIKVMANLRTDEHQKTQDGKIVFETEFEELDLRVSIVPVTDGENIVMRLLSERSRQTALSELGLTDNNLAAVQEAYQKSHGMILATGPTGSGKTTTLYAVLKLLNKRDINIMTIEDPVEYDIEHVNQIQVNAKTELTFANGLRSIVRQDPDIILVGEIRDEETANIAVNAAMTGHLVLSTLHTNDAATTFPRLIDMSVEPYLVASSVNVVIAQRLVRKICVSCRASTKLDTAGLSESLQKKLTESKVSKVYQGKGCEVCHQTGYQGRIGIYEVMVVDESLREAISAKQNADQIKTLAVQNGMTTMLEDGIKKIKEGITTLEEVLRVTSE